MQLSNIAWTFAGLVTPLLVAALTIPSLIEIIGLERFGLLALAWGMIGYAGVCDLGIGRATTQLIAQLRGNKAHCSIPFVISSAVELTFKSGAVGLLLLALAACCGLQRLINHSQELQSEITISIVVLSLAIPVQAVSATYRGVNEAFENFRGISLLRMGLGIANFLGPYLIAQYTSRLSWLVVSLLLSRLLALAVFRFLAIRCVKRQHGQSQLISYPIDEKTIKKSLFSFGGWFTVSSIISPILTQGDRYVIAGLISATAVASYTIPYDVVVQTLLIVGAVSSVAFPSLTKQLHENPKTYKTDFHRWLTRVAIAMLIVTSALAFSLPVLLPLWLGPQLPIESVGIGQILCIGVYANSIGSMYFALLHAKGRSDVTAMLHMFELPVFILCLYILIEAYGVYGAAWAWVLRMMIDALLLTTLNRYINA